MGTLAKGGGKEIMQKNGSIFRIGLIGVGLLVFLLLFFADKSNLTNENPTTVGGANASRNESVSGDLPPLAPDAQLDRQIAAFGAETGKLEKIRLLDTIIVSLQARNRLAYAANYAEQLVLLDSSLQNRLQAGALSQQATELPYIASNSELMTRYNNRSIALLQKVLVEEPENETALLHYGLAVAQSPQPMQGILSLRKLTEINPGNIEAQFRLGMFSIQTQQYEKAVERFRQVLVLAPERSDVRYHLAFSQLQLGEKQEALTLLEQILTDKTAPAELKQQANSLIDQL